MTKLEILKSYPSSRIRDTWFVLGENTCTSSTRIYNKDLIYKNGYLFINPEKIYVMNEILLKLI